MDYSGASGVVWHVKIQEQLWDTTLRMQEAVNEGFEVDYSGASGVVWHVRIQEPTQDFLPLVIGISVAGVGMLICFGIWYTQYRKSLYKCIRLINGKIDDQSLKALLKQYGSLAPKRYNYREIKQMTHGFKDKLGEGGYGGVYKGELSDGRAVAVKILKASKGDGEEFINEDASINQTSHVNIMSLLGYSLNGRKRALIYDFIPNGSLEKYIYGDGSLLGLQKLYQIAVGIAEGLEYLDRGYNTTILHFDIKPHNILLDEEFCPKISDFGLVKLCTRKENIVSMLGARGAIRTTSTGVFFADEIVGNYVRGCSFSIVVPLVSTAYQQLWDTTLRLQEAVNEGFEVDYSGASGGCLAC
ncbi:hypothetical protein K7X08_000258 [Anisodus acutangulus]|uniref:Protein kinase domain-containing protein n=1 Tax=Anisodus acutangulus TaxID=402998 RepID=A0A9Q1M6M8_9SOLA|nr:hypothetical protein K7X08_000258 [Anisodus acutangulus]